MAGTAGSGGLGALGIGGIAAAAVVAGGVAAYLMGAFGPGSTPEPGSEPSAEPAVAAPANGNTAPSGTAPEQTADAPAPKPAEQPAAEQDEAETAAVEQPAPAAPSEPEAEPAAEAEAQPETDGAAADAAPAGQEDAAAPAEPAPADTAAAPAAEADSAAADAAPARDGTEQNGTEAASAEEQDTAADAGSAPAEGAAGAADEPQAEQPAEAAPAAAEPAFVLAPPQLDTVRFEPDGSGLIAGRAQPGSEISILLDGEVLDRFPVDAGGEFVAFVAAPPSENQRVLSLLASLNGQTAVSDASFILGATRVPVVVAEADTAPAPETAAQQPEAAADTPAADDAAEEPAEESAAALPEDQQPAASEAAAAAEPEEETQATEAPAAVAVLRADSSGITVVQPAANGRSDAVALDTLSYTDTGNVEVAGRASPDTALRVYVDNTAATDLRSASDGSWSVSLGGIAPGSYTLRVDQVNAQGIVLSRVETPFTREAPEVLAEAAPEADPQAPEPLLRAITVRKGDSLWAISRKAYGDGRLYVRLFDANRNEIKDPDLIYPGQVFALPE